MTYVNCVVVRIDSILSKRIPEVDLYVVYTGHINPRNPQTKEQIDVRHLSQ